MYQYGKHTNTILANLSRQRQQQLAARQQAEAQGGGGGPLAQLAGPVIGAAAKKAVGKGLGALFGGGGGSAALTTQGAAGYDATATVLPELFGGSAPVSTAISSSAPMSYNAGAGLSNLSSGASSTTAASGAPPATPGYGIGGPLILSTILTSIANQLTKSGKSGDDRQRDSVKNKYQELGITDDSYMTPTGINVGGGLGALAGAPGGEDYNLDHNNPLVSNLIEQVNPISRYIAGGNQKAVDDSTGMLVNSVLASKPNNEEEANRYLENIFANLNVNRDQISQGLQSNSGGVSDRDALMSFYDRLEDGSAESGWAVPNRSNPNNLKGMKDGALYKLPSGLYGQVLQKGVADQDMADRLGAQFNADGGVPTSDLAKFTIRNNPNLRSKLDSLTEDEQAIALDQLNRVKFLR